MSSAGLSGVSFAGLSGVSSAGLSGVSSAGLNGVSLEDLSDVSEGDLSDVSEGTDRVGDGSQEGGPGGGGPADRPCRVHTGGASSPDTSPSSADRLGKRPGGVGQ